MTRKKVKLAYIENYAQRKISFGKRIKGLLNKVKEINTLCGVDACAIVYGANETEPYVWPSVEGVYAVMGRFYALPVADRTKQMVNHNDFIQMRSKKMRKKIDRLQRENKRIEAEIFVYQCRLGITSIDQMGMGYKDEMGCDARSGGGGGGSAAVAPTFEVAGVGLNQGAPPTSGVAAPLVDPEIWEPLLRADQTLFQPDLGVNDFDQLALGHQDDSN